MLDQMTGPVGVFQTMTAPCERKATAIDIIEPAVFSVLEMEFPVVEPPPVVPPVTIFPGLAAFTAPTYPATFRLVGVKRFQLTSGSIMVAFRS